MKSASERLSRLLSSPGSVFHDFGGISAKIISKKIPDILSQVSDMYADIPSQDEVLEWEDSFKKYALLIVHELLHKKKSTSSSKQLKAQREQLDDIPEQAFRRTGLMIDDEDVDGDSSSNDSGSKSQREEEEESEDSSDEEVAPASQRPKIISEDSNRVGSKSRLSKQAKSEFNALAQLESTLKEVLDSSLLTSSAPVNPRQSESSSVPTSIQDRIKRNLQTFYPSVSNTGDLLSAAELSEARFGDLLGAFGVEAAHKCSVFLSCLDLNSLASSNNLAFQKHVRDITEKAWSPGDVALLYNFLRYVLSRKE